MWYVIIGIGDDFLTFFFFFFLFFFSFLFLPFTLHYILAPFPLSDPHVAIQEIRTGVSQTAKSASDRSSKDLSLHVIIVF